MNCFNHHDRAAVGLCKSCGKGLCPDCLCEVENGLACKNRCEPRVQLINRIIDSNKQVLTVARSQMRGQVVFLLVMGGIFLLLGAASFATVGPFGGLFPLVLGVAFCVTGLLRLRSKAQYPSIEEPSPSTRPQRME